MNDQALDEPDNDDDRPFTPSERKALRKILIQEERAKWFWSTARVWVSWGAATIGTLYACRDYIKGAIRGAFQ